MLIGGFLVLSHDQGPYGHLIPSSMNSTTCMDQELGNLHGLIRSVCIASMNIKNIEVCRMQGML
jgi:hypothetical protein